MPPVLYDLSVPVYIRSLENLLHVLKKGEEHAKENGYDVDKLAQSRLAPDMNVLLPFSIHCLLRSHCNEMHIQIDANTLLSPCPSKSNPAPTPPKPSSSGSAARRM